MRRATLNNSFTKGVLDPDLSERVDLAQYYDSLAAGENCIFYPQGGVGDRGGFQLISDADVLAAGVARRLRRRLDPVPLTANMLTAVHNGVTANLVDQDRTTLFTTDAISGNPFVALEIDLGVTMAVGMVDLIDFKVGTAPINETLAVEFWNGSGWQAWGGSLGALARRAVRTTSRTRRFAGWPGETASARQWRIALYGATGAGTLSIGGIRMWREGLLVSPVRLQAMARSKEDAYELVLTDRNIDVYQGQRWLAAMPSPIAGQYIREIGPEPSLDTCLLFHVDLETVKIVRQGSDVEWNAEPATWTNTPNLSLGTAFSGTLDEHQQLTITGASAGDSVVLALGDLLTEPIVYGAGFAAAAVAALKTLPGVAADGITVTETASGVFAISFINDNGGRAWPPVNAIVLASTALAETTVTQRGLDTASTLWGARTGWPGCGAFVDSRLMLAGFRAAPTTFALSVVAQYYDFTSTGSPLTADKAFVRSIDTDQIETIQEVFVGRHVQLFTSTGEYFIEKRTFDATQPVTISLATRNGAKRGVPMVFAEGATLFVQEGGRTLRDFLYDFGEQSYKAEPLSLLAPHLINDVVDLAHRPARSVSEGHRVMLINADGSAAMLTFLRGQSVIAMAPWTTDGQFRAAMVDQSFNLIAAIERNGDLWLERWTPAMPLDAATREVAAPRTVVTHQGHLEGETVWAIADGAVVGPLTVTGASVTLPEAAADVTVGKLPTWRARLPVLREKLQNATPFRPPARIYEVDLALVDTGAITLATNGKPHQEVPLTRTDDQLAYGGPLQTATSGAPGLPLMDRLYTGNVRVMGLTGFSRHCFVELSRSVPAPVHVKSARYEVGDRG